MAEPPRRPASSSRPDAAAIAAGAIGFDQHGRIIIDRQVQAEIAGFDIPPWLGSGFPTPELNPGCGGVVWCQPETACADVNCEPESICADVNCEPESICADVNCEPESICADVNCEPESICTDVACEPESICTDTDIACEPESICTDTQCEPESKCTDIFCKEKNTGCEINNGCTGGGSPPGQVEGQGL